MPTADRTRRPAPEFGAIIGMPGLRKGGREAETHHGTL